MTWMEPVRSWAAKVVSGACGFVLVVVYGLLVARRSSANGWDRQVLLDINRGHTPAQDMFTRALSIAFSTPFALLIIVALVVVLALAGRRPGDALFVGGTIGVIYACTYVVKIIVGRPRPAALPYVVPGLAPETDPSYPSGHVAITAALVVTLFLVARKAWQRRAIATAGTVLVLAVAFARLYVGAHYLDDVLASMVYVVTVGPLIYAGLRWVDARWEIVNRADHWAGRRWAYLAR